MWEARMLFGGPCCPRRATSGALTLGTSSHQEESFCSEWHFILKLSLVLWISGTELFYFWHLSHLNYIRKRGSSHMSLKCIILGPWFWFWGGTQCGSGLILSETLKKFFFPVEILFILNVGNKLEYQKERCRVKYSVSQIFLAQSHSTFLSEKEKSYTLTQNQIICKVHSWYSFRAIYKYVGAGLTWPCDSICFLYSYIWH